MIEGVRRGAVPDERSAPSAGTPRPVGPRATPARAAAVALVAALATGALALVAEAPRRPSAPQVFVIPDGTGARVRAGDSVADVLPQTVATGVGVPLVVENHDTENHAFGPFALAPGQSWRRQFAAPGTYGFSCSIYPTAGFTIDVAPAAGLGMAEALRRAWIVGWALLGVAALAALVGRATDLDALGQPAAVLAGAWAGATVGLIPLRWAAASRVADWGPALASRATGWQVAAALLAVVGLVGIARARAAARGGPARLAALAAVIVAAWWALAPDVGALGGWRAALALAGGGCLAAAAVAGRRPGAAEARARLGLAGAILLLGSIPVPPGTPPVTALLALPTLAAAVGVAAVAWLGGRRLGFGDDRGGLVRTAAGAVALAQLVVLWGALVGHVEATALPLDGNPVPATASSLARGAAVWDAECAACHASIPELAARVRSADDTSLLRLITDGRGDMPGFAYALDITARGDVLNVLRDAATRDVESSDRGPVSRPPSAP